MSPTDDPVMKRFRADLAKAYGERLDRVVLFGSRARGDFRPDSDYDVAVFLKTSRGLDPELRTIVDIGVEILFDSGAVINALPFESQAFASPSAFMETVRRDGVDL